MYGSKKDVKHNLFLFFVDGVVFMPAMTMISITTVIPYFLEQLGASTFQIALAASLALICNFIAQPFFGHIASRSKVMHNTFARILLLQRSIFLVFVLCIPLFASVSTVLVWAFLFFWGLFNFFVGSYSVFFTPMVIKLLPPDKRGFVRGMGYAAGSVLGLGMAMLIPFLLGRISFPLNYTVIFTIGLFFLFVDVAIFFLMRQHDDMEPNTPMSVIQYLKGMPSSIRENLPFRGMILTCMFLVVANSLLSYYTLYAVRVFSATESHLATLAALAVISTAAGHVGFGFLIDRRGPKTTSLIAAILVISAGFLALVTNTLSFLFAAWVLANLSNSSYHTTASLLLAEVSPNTKLPLYVGVYTTISLALSSAVIMLLAPVLEKIGFMALFAVVLFCGILSLLFNLFFLRRKMANAV